MYSRNSVARYIEEPAMSDKILVLDVEDLIALTFGPLETNSVNFSMMQTVLNILCRQMRVLEKTVEIRFEKDEERIQDLIQQLLEEESEDSSEFEEDRETRKRYVKENKSDDALTSDEIEDFVERKAKKSKDEVKKSHLTDEMDDDLSTSTEAEDDQEVKGKKGNTKAKPKSETQKMDDDIDSKRSKDKSRKKDMRADDGKKEDRDERYGMRQESKGMGKKEKTSTSAMGDVESPSSDDSENSGVKIDKKRRKPKSDETADDFTTLYKAKDTTNKVDKTSKDIKSKIDKKPKDEDTDQKIDKMKKGKKEATSRNTEEAVESYSSDESEDTEQEVKKISKGIRSVTSKKAAKADGSPKSQTTDRSDVSKKNVKTPKDKMKFKSQKRQASEDSVISDKSDDVSEIYVKKGKDTLKMQLKTKKADDDSDTVTDTKKESYVDKVKGKNVKGKKEVKSKRSESADDFTAELDETEYSGKGKGKKRIKREKEKDKKMAEMREVQEAGSKKGKAAADTHTKFGGISVTEIVRKGGKGPKDTILVVEKGPTTRDSYPRLGNIEVVTRSQFELIESDVKTLMEKSGPMPIPFMPDNKQLKKDLARGSATLPGAMEAMHLNARVKAAEEALSRMATLLTQVASDGTLPPETADMINQLQDEQRALTRLMSARGLSTKHKTSKAAIAPAATTRKTVKTEMYPPVRSGRPDSAKKRMRRHQQSIGSTASTMTSSSLMPPANPLLTQSDLSQALDNMRHEMMKKITEITAKSTETAKQAHKIAKAAVDKLAISLALNSRIEVLHKFTTEQKELLTGFDTGLSTQLQGFQEQLKLMRTELKDGLKHLDKGERLESLAVAALREQHETIEFMVAETVHHHEKLVITHKQMNDELKGMLDWVDLIRKEKAERADVAKGLDGKVNINELQGLLFEDAFEVSRKELNKKLDECYNEFDIIQSGWMGTLAALKAVSRKKANLMSVYSLQDYATDNIREFKVWLERLEDLLGDTQLALLTRLLSRGAYCGSCLVAAQMVPFDKNYKKPLPLPVFPVLGAFPKEPAFVILRPFDNRKDIIKRWVGGSHTLIKNPKSPEKLPQSQLQPTPTKHYVASGIDKHIDMMGEELEPCIQCMTDRLILHKRHPSTSDVGAVGDQSLRKEDENIQGTASTVSIVGKSRITFD